MAPTCAYRVHKQLRRQDVQVARCTVERLMRAHGLQGVHRRDRRRTTAPDESAPRPPDLVNRQFSPTGQTGCGWPTSPMCAPERGGCTWLLRRTPSPRRIVGWQLADHLRTDLPLERTGDGAVATRPRTASSGGRPDPSLRPGLPVRQLPLPG
ncbi:MULTISPECIES: IS3 family transposase [Actinomadura]|uniref:HTH-like domain-containing protein n=1 Tax=Actinomadura geliboluensis TaxID=882440 RepID=A0A5S4FRR8_9ACTN|nr:hypothetical protein ETD96_43510 [Actinomadura geliboluensis]